MTLITRPRRFDMTLAMSMLEHFFSVGYADKDVKETSFENARDKICRRSIRQKTAEKVRDTNLTSAGWGGLCVASSLPV